MGPAHWKNDLDRETFQRYWACFSIKSPKQDPEGNAKGSHSHSVLYLLNSFPFKFWLNTSLHPTMTHMSQMLPGSCLGRYKLWLLETSIRQWVTLPTSLVQEEPAPSFKDIQDNLRVPQKPAAMAEVGKSVGYIHRPSGLGHFQCTRTVWEKYGSGAITQENDCTDGSCLSFWGWDSWSPGNTWYTEVRMWN